MAKAIKLPSGNWRCQVYDYTDNNGKIHKRSFSAPTKREAEKLANIFLAEKDAKKRTGKTLGEAMQEYIDSKSNILSPATIKTYRGYYRNHFTDLRELAITSVNSEMVQAYINHISKSLEPKTVKNVHGFICAVLKDNDVTINTRLPQSKKTEMHIPSRNELDYMLEQAEQIEDKDLYLAILLASHLGLRRGEVCALTWEDINFAKGFVSINKALTVTEDSTFVEKSPKSFSGYRTVPVPHAALIKLEQYKGTGEVIKCTPSQLTNRWKRFRKKIGLPPYSYHNLRHYYASVMLDLGIPDKYAMELMGHATNKMLKEVYQHTNEKMMNEVSQKLSNYF